MWSSQMKNIYILLCVWNYLCDYASSDIKLGVSEDGRYTVYINSEKWLDSAHTFFQVQGQTYSSHYGNLKIANVSSSSGVDLLGKWKSTDFLFVANTTRILGVIKEYSEYPLFVFEQHFIDGAEGTNVGNPNKVVSSFPGFQIGTQEGMLGYFGYGGQMLGDSVKHAGLWNKWTTGIRDGVINGPITIFDKKGNVVIISAFNQFMAASNWHDAVFGGNVHWGIMGLVDSIPEGFVLKTGLFYGNRGINKAFEDWGTALRTLYNRKQDYVKADLAVNYLGYWTDNGAYYYYNPEANKTYEDTLLDVVSYSRQVGIPYRYIQYDTWWYSQGILTGTMVWDKAMSSIFPHGLQYFYNKTGLPVIAHNRFWSFQTPYARQNGGKYNFVMDVLKSVPNDQIYLHRIYSGTPLIRSLLGLPNGGPITEVVLLSFWDWLLQETKKWGLITYEQDFLDVQFLGVKSMLTDITLGRKWLMQMGEAARKTGMTIQYCMSNSRHGMQSLEIPTVTQIRVSDDYSPGQNNWKTGVTSMFAYALGLAPFKDTFWTTTYQPGNPYYDNLEEYYPDLNAAVSVLAAGLVGPGDAIGKTNVSLLMRCCNSDGLILKPSKPATAIDAQFMQWAFQDGSGPQGEVWSTYSEVSGLYFGTIFAAQLKEPFTVTPESVGFSYSQFGATYVYMDNPHHAGPVALFDDQHPFVLTGCTLTNFCLYHVTPSLTIRGQQLLLYGEISKWMPMSYKRVTDIAVSSNDVVITLQGGAGEAVQFWINLEGKPIRIDCKMSNAGTSRISVLYQRCN